MNLEQQEKRFQCCNRPITQSEVKAVCSCGDVYCATCLSILAPDELTATIQDSLRQGHFVTVRP